ncbi:TPA: superinfection immunity protein [Streptococcus suis]|nr:superinfection immunity protein [Streptococcus suis]HEM5287632.1 superinfection immunity protein [Streptococcus suis]HEM5297710.1 superinfection immunity protein [Streptococcus suis]HEM6244838.1 superinfection immunity protein [Streptococcus suis]
MNQKDWVEYFEAMNGRKPTASEFSEALEKREFIIESDNTDSMEDNSFVKEEGNFFRKLSDKYHLFLIRIMYSNTSSSTRNYNQPLSGFQLKKYGSWLNFAIIFIDFIFFAIIASAINHASDSMTEGISIVLLIFCLLLSVFNSIPTLISHTRWKYLIFLLNIFLGPTIIGWLVLLIIAISTNNSAKREQEMAYLLRMMSDKLGDDQ